MKNKSDLISIIIPTYGRSISLEETVRSAINQTYKNIEIIVVDDNNPDTIARFETEKKIEEIREYYPNLIYLQHEKNKNGAAARNTGIKKSKGKYIAFLDDDDAFLENKIELQYNYLKENPQYKCVGCGYIKNNIKTSNKLFGNLSKEILTLKFDLTTSALFFEREALLDIGCFDEKFIRHQDYELLLKYFKKYEIGYLEEPLIIRGINKGENIPTGKKAEKVKRLFLSSFKDTIDELDLKEKGFKKKVFIKNYYALFLNHVKNFHFLLALKNFFRIFFISPFAIFPEVIETIKRKIH